ncbi:MAG: glycosyltransferase family A protein [Terracidiphilus sp.]|jgi:glycosyltransferase involved in cell wall biosynthesis
MTEELVSIIIPAFNAERFIAKALESVCAQTYRSWEVVFIDDGGTDGTLQLVTEFSSKVSRLVQILRHARARGPSAARNTGMKAAKGQFIAFLDADDFWLPDHLESLCAILRSGKADLAYSDCFVFREALSGDVELLPIDTTEVKNPATDLFRRNFINPSGAAITCGLMEKVGEFDQTMRGTEDADYWIRAAINGYQIASTGKQTYYYRKSVGSLSAAPARMAEGIARVYEKHLHCGLLPEAELAKKATQCYFAAGKLHWRHNAASASHAFYQSWRLDKRNPMPLLWFFFTSGLSLTRRGAGNS